MPFFNYSKFQLIEDLNAGKTPLQFLDRYKVYPPNQPNVAETTNYLTSIIHKILDANQSQIWKQYGYDIDLRQPKIFISYDDKENAFTFPDAKPPVIVITTALLKNAKSEDELAGILAHEIHHILLPKITKQSNQGQIGEVCCDVWAAEAIRNAGYDSHLYADFFRRDVQFTSDIFSSHPAHDVRISLINNVKVYLDKSRGKETYNVSQASLKKMKSGLPTDTRISMFDKILMDNGDNYSQPKLERLQILINCIQENKIDIPNRNVISGCCLYETEIFKYVTNHIEKLLPIPADKNSRFFAMLIDFKKWLISYGDNGYLRQFVTATLEQWIRSNSLCKTDQHYLWQAETNLTQLTRISANDSYEKIKQIAEETVNILKNHYANDCSIYILKNYDYKFLMNVQKTFFPTESTIDALGPGQTLIPAWELLVEHALNENKKEGTTFIANVLFNLGINDPRLTSLFPKLPYPICVCEYNIAVPIDIEGRIFNPKTAIQDQEEEKALRVIHWDALRAPPQGLGFSEFIKTYINFFRVSDSDPNDRRYPFANVFFEKLIGLSASEKIQITEAMLYSFIDSFSAKIPLHHPLVIFITNKAVALLFLKNETTWEFYRDKILYNSKYYKEEPIANNNPKITWLCDYRKILGINKINTRADLIDIINCSLLTYGRAFTLEVIYHEATIFIENNMNHLSHDDLNVLNRIMPWNKLDKGPTLEKKYQFFHKAKLKLEDKLFNDAMNITTDDAASLMRCINTYKSLSQFTITQDSRSYGSKNLDKDSSANFNHPYFQARTQKEQQLLNKITHAIQSINASTEEQIALCENIIFRETNTIKHPKLDSYESYYYHQIYHNSFTNRELRDFYLNHYVTLLERKLGKDKETNGYYSGYHFKNIVKSITDRASPLFVEDLMNRFAEAILSQSILSSYMEDCLKEAKKADVSNFFQIGNVAFVLIEELCKYDKGRDELRRFLLAPYSPESAEALFEIFFRSLSYLSRDFFLPKLNWDTLFDQDKELQLRFMHKEFWESQDLVRMGLFQKLLYSTSNRPESERDHHAKQIVLDTVLPITQNSSSSSSSSHNQPTVHKDESNHIEERKIVNAYLSASTPEEQRVLLSLMLASQSPYSDLLQKRTRGEMLKIILNNLGPAGVKLSQAIGSYPQTPEELRAEMNLSKAMSNKPYRWELFRILRDSYPGLNEISYVDCILGAGAFGITLLAYNYGTHGNKAITLLRPFAANRSKSEFETLRKAAQLLVSQHPEYEPVLEMISQAEESAHNETNMEVANQQNLIAHDLYKNITVTLIENNKKVNIHFVVADWIGFGPKYKETAYVPGEHFLELPEITQAQKQRKRRLAIAILTIEFKNLAAGKSFDHDRHGAQQRIVGNMIGLFDFGGVTLTPPTKEQKALLGSILAEVVVASDSGEDLLPSFQRILRNIKVPSEDKKFLATVERAVLALSDYIRHVDKDDFAAIIYCVYQHLDIDVKKTFSQKLAKQHGASSEYSLVQHLYNSRAASQFENIIKSKSKMKISITQSPLSTEDYAEDDQLTEEDDFNLNNLGEVTKPEASSSSNAKSSASSSPPMQSKLFKEKDKMKNALDFLTTKPLENAANIIKKYIDNPNPKLSITSSLFDRESGRNRANYYHKLLTSHSLGSLQKLIILYALLTDKGTVLKNDICEGLGLAQQAKITFTRNSSNIRKTYKRTYTHDTSSLV